jgi:cytochrome c551/c552
MNARTMPTIMIIAAALALASCQQSGKPAAPPATAAMQPAPEALPAAPAAQPEAPAAMTAKPEAPAAKPAAPAMTPKPAATMTPKPAAPAPAPAPKPKAAAPVPKPVAMAPTNPFNTAKCAACHAVDQDKVGPAWKTVVEKYGDAATLAKDFESGFKERRVANSIAKWKSKEGLMTSQFNNLIKGHEKEAAHALFETVKNGKFGSY